MPAAPAAARTQAAGAPSPGDDAAIAGFLAAVGLGGTAVSDAEKAALMKLAGETLAATVKGLTEILAARSTTKQEFRIERTTIGAMGNNPLKFSASLDEAMRVMLLGRVPGFLTAKQAIEEALGDVKSHQLAVLAGMQVALTTVIARFDPAKLEKRIEQSSLIEGILPAARKARYWELFKTLYKEIATELEDDFQSLFGAEFARAYKEQIDKL
jgi:type VI secretion system FHA domain protein